MKVNEARKQCCLEIPESPMPKDVGFKKGKAWSDDGREKALEPRRGLQYLYGSDIAFLGLVMMLKASTMKDGGDSFSLQTYHAGEQGGGSGSESGSERHGGDSVMAQNVRSST